MNFGLRKLAVCLFCLGSFFSGIIQASTLKDTEDINDGKIDVLYGPETNAPYIDRRTNWGFSFGLNQENILPNNFISTQDGNTYKDLFGTMPVRLFQVSAGFKYNISFGALSAEGIVGM